jgi:hypothetical protein
MLHGPLPASSIALLLLAASTLDPAHAHDITKAQDPTGRLSAVPAELLDGQHRQKLLTAWLREKG